MQIIYFLLTMWTRSNTKVMRILTGRVGRGGSSVFCVVFSCVSEVFGSFVGHILSLVCMMESQLSQIQKPRAHPQASKIRTFQGGTPVSIFRNARGASSV